MRLSGLKKDGMQEMLHLNEDIESSNLLETKKGDVQTSKVI